MHEAQLHDNNCFVTLTYNDSELPENGSLDKTHLQKFFKRLRHHKGTFRYFACGEYGEETQRAHYHACIFGLDFEDKTHFRRIGEHNLYISDELNEIWGHGQTSIGSLTYESAGYTASYVLKTTLGKGCPRYCNLDDETGELLPLQQPFAVMSLKPAIGLKWLHAYSDDIYGHDKDFVVLKGRKLPVPKYYDKIYDTIDGDHLASIKSKRKLDATPKDNAQLRARARITHARMYRKAEV